MRRPPSVSVKARQLGQVALDHVESNENVLSALH